MVAILKSKMAVVCKILSLATKINLHSWKGLHTTHRSSAVLLLVCKNSWVLLAQKEFSTFENGSEVAKFPTYDDDFTV